MTLDQIWDNPLMWTDVYNTEHYLQKIDQSFEVSHIYNRNAPMILYGFHETVKKILNRRIYPEQVEEAIGYARKMGMKFPADMWFKIVNEFKGRIPLRVQALPDGSWVPKGTPFCQIYNTEEGFGELVTWWEAMFLHASFASGCATRAFEMRKYLLSKNYPLHRFHSFGFRGHNSMENAYWAGTSWNLFLTGTDDFHTKYHTPNVEIKSIPALAHKVVQQFDNEMDAYETAIFKAINNKGDGTGICAIVIDTYDPQRFIDIYLEPVLSYAMYNKVHVVFRPDSGPVLRHACDIYKKAAWKIIGNDPRPYCSVIIGEGMSFNKAQIFDMHLKNEGVPPEFVNYGIGAGFYKDIDRDYLGWAMKTAYSNHDARMKFSADEIKQSIPGQVNIVKNDEGKLMVDYTRDGLYEDLYFYDSRSDAPYVKQYNWENIQARALKQDDNQDNIILSNSITNKIAKIRKDYGL